MSNQHLIHLPTQPTLSSLLENLLSVKFNDLPRGGPSLSVPQAESRADELIDITVRFPDDAEVPFPFQGRSLRTKVSRRPDVLLLRPDERPLALWENRPIWAVSQGTAVKHFRSSLSLPVVPANGSLHDVLNEYRFLEMIPLLHWLRAIGVDSPSDSSTLRACFIFDDPNLHWPRYGFVDYAELAKRAQKENYHVAFATIPLDTWFTHQETAAIFRNNRQRLSLLVHGNDHTKAELARPCAEAERTFLLKQ